MASGLMSSRCLQQASQRPCVQKAYPRPWTISPVVPAPQTARPVDTPSRSPWHHAPRQSVVAAAVAKAASTVKVIIQGRKLEVTDAIKQYVESKIGHCLSHYGQEIKEVDVTLSARGGDTGTKGNKEQKVEVTVYTLRNGVQRVEDGEDTLYAAIDLVADKLARKMSKVKDRAISKGKWPGRAGPKEPETEEQEFKEYMQEVAYETAVFERDAALQKQFADLNKEFPPTVRRTKIIELDPITVDEAIEAMEAVGHDFYVFREIETDAVQVVYRRQTEGYGVLIPRKKD